VSRVAVELETERGRAKKACMEPLTLEPFTVEDHAGVRSISLSMVFISYAILTHLHNRGEVVKTLLICRHIAVI
jgi:hypothetical protein